MRIALTHNLKTAEAEEQAEFDTIETVKQLADGLVALGHEVHPIDVAGPVSRLVARLETLRPDLVFNTAEGSVGRFREAFYPALFEQLHLPFTGSDAWVCAATLDKQATKLMVQRVGVPTPRWQFLDAVKEGSEGQADASDLRFPVIVKPNFEGSSKGISARSIVRDADGLWPVVDELFDRYATGVLIEEFVVGRDVTVPFLEAVGVLDAASYDFGGNSKSGFAIYDYALKNELSDQVSLQIPADVPPDVAAKLAEYAGVVVRELGIRDLGRVDFRVTDEGEIFFIEVNALPSLESGASLYLSAASSGLTREVDVLEAVVSSAVRRQHVALVPPRPTSSLRIGLAHNVRRVDPRADDRDAEFDSPRTIEAICSAIAALGHEVVPIEATPNLVRTLGDLGLDLVFNIAEGLRGRSREAQIPALLELLDIPYTGSDAAALAVALDKGLAKRIVRAAGVPTAAWQVVAPGQPLPTNLRYPLIAKPNAEGSSKGVTSASVARDDEALRAAIDALHQRFLAPVLVEEFLPGREFTVGLVGEIEPLVLPLLEVVFQRPAGELPIYSYASKTEEELDVSFEVPATVDDHLAEQIRQVALQSFEALGCRDVARIDVRLDVEGRPCFIECNPLPGLSPGFSDLCVAAEACGMDHGALIAAILAPAIRRLAESRVLAETDRGGAL